MLTHCSISCSHLVALLPRFRKSLCKSNLFDRYPLICMIFFLRNPGLHVCIINVSRDLAVAPITHHQNKPLLLPFQECQGVHTERHCLLCLSSLNAELTLFLILSEINVPTWRSVWCQVTGGDMLMRNHVSGHTNTCRLPTDAWVSLRQIICVPLKWIKQLP